MGGGDAALVRVLQERAARAQPAAHVEVVDGWWLRHGGAGAWWVGSVLPHGGAGPAGLAGLADRVAGAEAFYAGRGAPARFQITPGACPAGLDALLAARGYRRACPTALLVAATAAVQARAPTGPLRARTEDRPTDAWSAAGHAALGADGDPRAEGDRLGRVVPPCAYATVRDGDRVVAVGRAVAEAGWAGVFGMATRPGDRGKGAARTVLAALAGWAGAQGADHLYLQVERANGPALGLYRRMGFRLLRGYHYRLAA